MEGILQNGWKTRPASLTPDSCSHNTTTHLLFGKRILFACLLERKKKLLLIYENTSQKGKKKKQVLFYSWHLIIDHNNAWGEVVCCTALAETFSCSSFKNQKMLQPKCAWIHTAPECTCIGQRATFESCFWPLLCWGMLSLFLPLYITQARCPKIVLNDSLSAHPILPQKCWNCKCEPLH